MGWFKTCQDAVVQGNLSQCEPMGLELVDAAKITAIVIGGTWAFIKFVWPVLKNRLNNKAKITPIAHAPDSGLTGRDDDIKAIREHFGYSQKPLVLHGGAGVGKTVLARSVAQADYKDRWVMLPLGSDSEMKTALEPYAQQLGISEDVGLDAFIRNTLEAMRADSKRWLIIFDNADSDAEADRARKYTVETNDLDFMITSQRGNWPEAFTTRPLDVLDLDAAAQLLSKLSGRRVDDDLKALAIELDRLPLALTLIGTDLANMPADMSVVAYTKSFTDRLAAVPDNERYKKSVVTAVQMAFERLGDEAKAVLKIAAFMDPNDIDGGFFTRGAAGIEDKGLEALPEPLNALCNNEVMINRALADCVNHSLLYTAQWRGEDTRRIHRTTQYALRQAMAAEKAVYAGLMARLGRAQLSGSAQFDTQNWPAYHRLAPHAEAFMSADDILVDEDGKLALAWLNQMGVFLAQATRDDNRTVILGSCEVLWVERLYGSTSIEYAASLNNLVSTKDQLARTQTGAVRAALDKDVKEGFHTVIKIKSNLPNSELSLASTHNQLASFYWARKRFPEAETDWLKALELSQENQVEAHLIASTFGNLGVLYGNWARDELDPKKSQELQDKALSYAADSLTQTRQALGEVHLETALRLNNLSVQYNDIQEPLIGLPYAIRAVSVLALMVKDGSIPESHPSNRKYGEGLTFILTKLNRDPAKASALVEAAKPQMLADQEQWRAAKEAGTLERYVPLPIAGTADSLSD